MQDAINNQRASAVHQLESANHKREIQRELRAAINEQHTGCFIVFSVITNIDNKKTPNAYAEPSTQLFSTPIAPELQFPLISSDYAENWPEPVQHHLQRLMADHLISACRDTQFQ
jgi:hypothetical protein